MRAVLLYTMLQIIVGSRLLGKKQYPLHTASKRLFNNDKSLFMITCSKIEGAHLISPVCTKLIYNDRSGETLFLYHITRNSSLLSSESVMIQYSFLMYGTCQNNHDLIKVPKSFFNHYQNSS